MNRTLLSLCLAALFVSAPVHSAQFGSGAPAQAAQEPAPAAAPAEQAAPVAAPAANTEVSVTVRAEVSPATQQLAQRGAQVEPTVEEVETQAASDMAQNFLNQAMDAGVLESGMGWNDAQQTYVAVGTAVFALDGVDATDFLKMRSIKAMEAELNAKRDIIEFARTELSADIVVTLPDTGLGTEFDEERAAVQRAIEKETRAFQQALAAVNEAKAKEFAGLDVEEFLVNGIAAVAKRFMIDIDISKLQANQAQKIQNLLANMEKIDANLQALKAKAEQLRGALQQENVSEVSTFASMALLGGMTIATFESVKDGQYEISVVTTWSASQEKLVRAFFENKDVTLRPGKASVGEFVKSLPLATTLGGRKFLDKDGKFHIVGIGAWPLSGKTSAARRAATGQARAQALSNIAFALRGDYEAKAVAQTKAQEIRDDKGGTKSQVAENLAETISGQIHGMQLQGVSTRATKVVKSPLNGQDMMVVVSAMSVGDAQAARNMEKTNAESAVIQGEANSKSVGKKAAYDDAVKAADHSREAFAEGAAEARAELAPTKAAPAKQAPAAAAQQKAPAKQAPATSDGTVREQSIQGGGQSIDAFGF